MTKNKGNFWIGHFTCGMVLAVMWQIGEFERNFMIMQTSSGTGENIMGDRCMLDERGGWGSFNSWEGVWPKWRIWSSTAFFITGSCNKPTNQYVSYLDECRQKSILEAWLNIVESSLIYLWKRSQIYTALIGEVVENVGCTDGLGTWKKAKCILQMRWNRKRAWSDCNSDRKIYIH